MEPFIQGGVLSSLTKGSHEELASKREKLVSQHFGGESLAVSNHSNHGVFLHGNEAFRAEFTRKKGVEELKDVSSLPGAVISEENVRGYVGHELSEMVSQVLAGDGFDGNRLRSLAFLVKEDESYWFQDHARALAESLEEDRVWRQAYEDNKEVIRSACRGKLKVLESVVPKTRYGKIPGSKIPDFTSELGESFGIMLNTLSGIVERLDGLLFVEDDDEAYSLTDVAESVLDEARSVIESGNAAAGLMKVPHLPVLATIHDSVSDMMREMVIVSEFLFRSQTKGAE